MTSRVSLGFWSDFFLSLSDGQRRRERLCQQRRRTSIVASWAGRRRRWGGDDQEKRSALCSLLTLLNLLQLIFKLYLSPTVASASASSAILQPPYTPSITRPSIASQHPHPHHQHAHCPPPWDSSRTAWTRSPSAPRVAGARAPRSRHRRTGLSLTGKTPIPRRSIRRRVAFSPASSHSVSLAGCRGAPREGEGG